jgi:hypothetical protein
VNTQTPKITTSSSPEIVYQKADVVQVARAALTTVRCHSPITDAARHPAKPNIAAQSAPSFPEIANDLSVFTCKHTVIRTLSLDVHRDDRVDFIFQTEELTIRKRYRRSESEIIFRSPRSPYY